MPTTTTDVFRRAEVLATGGFHDPKVYDTMSTIHNFETHYSINYGKDEFTGKDCTKYHEGGADRVRGAVTLCSWDVLCNISNYVWPNIWDRVASGFALPGIGFRLAFGLIKLLKPSAPTQT